MMPVSGPISFDISPYAKNYSLQQSTLVQKHTLSSCARAKRGDWGEKMNTSLQVLHSSFFLEVFVEEVGHFKVGSSRSICYGVICQLCTWLELINLL